MKTIRNYSLLTALFSLASLAANAAVYGTLNAQTNLVHAPRYCEVDGYYRGTATLDEPTANRLGYYLVLDEPPTPPTGYYAFPTGWAMSPASEAAPSRILRQYAVLPLPPEPARRIYKYDLSAACIEYGEITNLVAFVSADQGVKWMWDCAEILVENDPYFISATNTVIQSGLIEEAKVKAILDRAYELGQLSSAN